MKRDNLDFSTTGCCAMCNKKLDVTSTIIRQLTDYNGYTGCSVALCPECNAIAGKGDIDILKFRKKLEAHAKSLITQFNTFAKQDKGKIKFINATAEAVVRQNPFILDTWIRDKETALKYRLKLASMFEIDKDLSEIHLYSESNHIHGYLCPVCGGKIKCTNKLDELEPNSNLHFECENGCLWFDSEMVKRVFKKKAISCLYHRGPYETEETGRTNWYGHTIYRPVSCFPHFEDACFHEVIRFFAESNKLFNGLLNKFVHNRNRQECVGHTNPNGTKCQSNVIYQHCYECMYKRHASDIKEIRRKNNEEHGWTIGANSSLEDIVNGNKKTNITARTGCAFFCELTEMGDCDVCGLTGESCKHCYEDSECRNCEEYKAGKPSNWIASVTMCKHYCNGKCNDPKNCTNDDWSKGKCRYTPTYGCSGAYCFKIDPKHLPECLRDAAMNNETKGKK